MRSIVLCIVVSFVLIVSRLVAEQTAQDHPLVHADQVVARELAVKRFTTLPKGILFLRFENFSTKEAAQHAETPASAVVEWAGNQIGGQKERVIINNSEFRDGCLYAKRSLLSRQRRN